MNRSPPLHLNLNPRSLGALPSVGFHSGSAGFVTVVYGSSRVRRVRRGLGFRV